jgi:hypothetical protein
MWQGVAAVMFNILVVVVASGISVVVVVVVAISGSNRSERNKADD